MDMSKIHKAKADAQAKLAEFLRALEVYEDMAEMHRTYRTARDRARKVMASAYQDFKPLKKYLK